MRKIFRQRYLPKITLPAVEELERAKRSATRELILGWSSLVREENGHLGGFLSENERVFPPQLGVGPLAEMLYGYFLLRKQGEIDNQEVPKAREGLPFVQPETIVNYLTMLKRFDPNTTPTFLYKAYEESGLDISQEEENPLYFQFMMQRSRAYTGYENNLFMGLVDLYMLLKNQAIEDSGKRN